MSQNSSNKSSRGSIEESHSLHEVNRAKDKKHEDHESKKVAEGFAGETRTEVLGLDESSETNDKVSEVLTKSKDQNSSGSAGGKAYTSASKKDIEALKLKLLKNLPSEKVMRKQVEGEIRKEIKYLRKRAMSLIGANTNMSFFEMANLLKKIRGLKGVLYSLVKFSLERLKTLWLRFVHGIM